MLQLGFGRVVTTIPRRLIGKCRNVDLPGTSNAQFFYPCLKSCALHRDPEIVTLFSKYQRGSRARRLNARREEIRNKEFTRRPSVEAFDVSAKTREQFGRAFYVPEGLERVPGFR